MTYTEDYYGILGVDKNASKAEIDKAYKALLVKYHPDRNKSPDAQSKLSKISQAYSVLSNAEKKQEYDTKLRYSQMGNGGNQTFDMGMGDFFGADGADIFDIFNIFNMGEKRSKKDTATIRGEDISKVANITLEDAFNGCKINLEYEKYYACDSCNASGFKDGIPPKSCDYCKGMGVIMTSLGYFGYTKQKCPRCQGSKYASGSRCNKCNGEKRYKKRTSYTIALPHGISDNDVIQVAGCGNDGVGTKSGNLLLTIKIEKHNSFQKQGYDLYTATNVSISILVLGGEKEILGICDEKITLNITQGFNPEKNLLVSGKGMKYKSSEKRGNLYVKLIPIIPSNLSADAEELWRKIYKNENNEDPSQKRRWW